MSDPRRRDRRGQAAYRALVMGEVSGAALQKVLKETLGARRYLLFVRALRSAPADGRLLFWQSRELDALEAQIGLVVPRTARELLALVPLLPDPVSLAEADTPLWLNVEALGGSAPVQAWGTVGSWRWYFRARWTSWSLAASRGPVDPIDVFEDGEDTVYVGDDYGAGGCDASYMPHDEARYFIVRELAKLRER